MFTKWLSENTIQDKILDYNSYKPYPPAKERAEWEALEDDYKKQLISEGEDFLNYEWPSLNATLFMEFQRSGDRQVFEDPYFARRYALNTLIVAECVEYQGRFLDDIINGIWHICEESYWGISAHNFERPINLPNVENQYIDLFAAETSAMMAHAVYLLGDELDKVSPVVRRRVEYEIENRIKLPYLNRLDFGWMGFHLKGVNNWNPWIIGNVLNTFLLTEKDKLRCSKAIEKSMIMLQHFIDVYHEDGGCDEGPSYWDAAGGALFDCLDQFYMISDGKINFFEIPLVKEIGRYLYRVFIDGQYYVNCADGGAKVNISNHMVYRYGKRINDKKLMDLAIYSSKLSVESIEKKVTAHALKRYLPEVFDNAHYNSLTATAPYEKDVWLDGIQMAIARPSASKDGLFFMAKGGHNDESHNHNDVGTFSVYKNGIPGLIDLGVETYTRFTFSEKRYDIWTMQSAYHNLATINDAMQLPGADKKATNVFYSMTDDEVNFSLDITDAYGDIAKIKKYNRNFIYKRNVVNEIELTDTFDFIDDKGDLMLSFMTQKKPVISENGKIIITLSDSDCLTICYDSDLFTDINIEEYAITDNRLKSSWDDLVYRFTIKANNISSGKTTITVK